MSKNDKMINGPISILPYDMHLNIINYLAIYDAINYGIFLNKEKNVKEYMLREEYIRHFLRTKKILEIRDDIIQSTIQSYGDILIAFQKSAYKPIRLNTENGIFYTIYPNRITHSIQITDIKVDLLPQIDITFIFKTITVGEFHIYYSGLNVFLIIIDDPKSKTRNIFVRIPYNCEDYIYGFIGIMVRLFAKRIAKDTSKESWNIHCEYMLCQDTNNDPLFVSPIMPNYNTRNIDTFQHQFLEKILRISLADISLPCTIRAWNIESSSIQKGTALMKYSENMNSHIENYLQRIGFANNKEIPTDIFLNPQTYNFQVLLRVDLMNCQEEVGEN